MARTKVPLTAEQVQAAIDQAERERTEIFGMKPFDNRSALFARVAEILGGKATAPVIYLRFQEFDLTCQTPMGRRGRQPREEREQEERADEERIVQQIRKSESTPAFDIQLLEECFGREGLEVTTVASLLTSEYFDVEENKAIRRAWHRVRAKLGIPAPKIDRETREFVV